MKGKESFSSRLTRRVVFTVLVIMTIISVFVFFVASAGILVFSKAHYSDIMDKAQGNMSLIMSKVEVSADNIIDELSWHLANPEEVTETLEYELNVNRHINGCGMGFVPDFFQQEGRWFEPYALNTGDEIIMKTIGSDTHDYFNAEWYTQAIENPEGVWSNPYLDNEGAGTILCTYSRIVLQQPEGILAGVFGADISLEELSSMIVSIDARENEDSPFSQLTPENSNLDVYSFIIGPDGDFIAHPDKERILKTNIYDYATGKGADKYKKLGDAMRAGETGEMTVMVDGIKSDVYYAPLFESGWSMGVVVPLSRMISPGLMIGAMALFLILLGLLVVFFTCQHSIEKSSKPLMGLAESAQEVAMGKFDTELPEIDTNDELSLLRDSFDNMQKSLTKYIQELTEKTAQNATMQRELGVARNIQMSMLPLTWPAFPDRTDIDIFGSVTPAKAVGGDLYDFDIRDGKLFFCIGDVSGKGIPASLVMTVISSMFRTLTANENSPAKIVSSINSSTSVRNDSMMFVTLFVGVLNIATGELHYSNAGHNAPIVISNGKPHMLKVDSNVPVGVVSDWKFTQQKTKLDKGSVLFLYTDGLTEATRAGGELFKEERVLDKLSDMEKDISTKDIVQHMSEAVSEFVGDSEQSDDLTMLALRILQS